MSVTKRGLIVRPTVVTDNFNGEIEPQLLNKLILYWDVLEYPAMSGISPNYSVLNDMELLKKEGIIQESFVLADEKSAKVVDYLKYNSSKKKFIIDKDLSNLKKAIGHTQVELCKHKNYVDKNTIWSIGDLNDDISKMYFEKANKDSVLMEFYDFLPVPCKTVKLEKILEFKLKRKDEILYLRTAIDELSSTVCKSENIDLELKRQKETIEKCLLDLHRVLDETKIQKICSNLHMYLNIDKNEMLSFVSQSAMVGLFAKSFAFGLLMKFGVNVLVKIGMKKVSKIDKIPDHLKYYIYAYNIERKLK